MKILIVAATWKEISPVADYIGHNTYISDNSNTENLQQLQIEILVTGVGIVSTVYELTKHLANRKYDLLINAGIAGVLDNSLNVGDVIAVSKESFGDLGLMMEDGFKTLFEMEFIRYDEFPYSKGFLLRYSNKQFNSVIAHLKSVSGSTVNKAGDYKDQANYTREKFGATIETMESAAFFYVCLKEKIPFIAIRSISNKVSQRDQAGWNIPLAIKNLNHEVLEVISKIQDLDL